VSTSSDLQGYYLFTWDLSNADLLFDAGDVFCFVLQANSSGYNIAGDADGYDRGSLYGNGVEFTGLSDIAFITHVEPVPLPAVLFLFGSGILDLIAVGRSRRAP
jgi:hypothetical protein